MPDITMEDAESSSKRVPQASSSNSLNSKNTAPTTFSNFTFQYIPPSGSSLADATNFSGKTPSLLLRMRDGPPRPPVKEEEEDVDMAEDPPVVDVTSIPPAGASLLSRIAGVNFSLPGASAAKSVASAKKTSETKASPPLKQSAPPSTSTVGPSSTATTSGSRPAPPKLLVQALPEPVEPATRPISFADPKLVHPPPTRPATRQADQPLPHQQTSPIQQSAPVTVLIPKSIAPVAPAPMEVDSTVVDVAPSSSDPPAPAFTSKPIPGLSPPSPLDVASLPGPLSVLFRPDPFAGTQFAAPKSPSPLARLMAEVEREQAEWGQVRDGLTLKEAQRQEEEARVQEAQRLAEEQRREAERRSVERKEIIAKRLRDEKELARQEEARRQRDMEAAAALAAAAATVTVTVKQEPMLSPTAATSSTTMGGKAIAHVKVEETSGSEPVLRPAMSKSKMIQAKAAARDLSTPTKAISTDAVGMGPPPANPPAIRPRSPTKPSRSPSTSVRPSKTPSTPGRRSSQTPFRQVEVVPPPLPADWFTSSPAPPARVIPAARASSNSSKPPSSAKVSPKRPTLKFAHQDPLTALPLITIEPEAPPPAHQQRSAQPVDAVLSHLPPPLWDEASAAVLDREDDVDPVCSAPKSQPKERAQKPQALAGPSPTLSAPSTFPKRPGPAVTDPRRPIPTSPPRGPDSAFGGVGSMRESSDADKQRKPGKSDLGGETRPENASAKPSQPAAPTISEGSRPRPAGDRRGPPPSSSTQPPDPTVYGRVEAPYRKPTAPVQSAAHVRVQSAPGPGPARPLEGRAAENSRPEQRETRRPEESYTPRPAFNRNRPPPAHVQQPPLSDGMSSRKRVRSDGAPLHEEAGSPKRARYEHVQHEADVVQSPAPAWDAAPLPPPRFNIRDASQRFADDGMDYEYYGRQAERPIEHEQRNEPHRAQTDRYVDRPSRAIVPPPPRNPEPERAYGGRPRSPPIQDPRRPVYVREGGWNERRRSPSPGTPPRYEQRGPPPPAKHRGPPVDPRQAPPARRGYEYERPRSPDPGYARRRSRSPPPPRPTQRTRSPPLPSYREAPPPPRRRSRSPIRARSPLRSRTPPTPPRVQAQPPRPGYAGPSTRTVDPRIHSPRISEPALPPVQAAPRSYPKPVSHGKETPVVVARPQQHKPPTSPAASGSSSYQAPRTAAKPVPATISTRPIPVHQSPQAKPKMSPIELDEGSVSGMGEAGLSLAARLTDPSKDLASRISSRSYPNTYHHQHEGPPPPARGGHAPPYRGKSTQPSLLSRMR